MKISYKLSVAYEGVWGRSPKRSPGAEPLVGGSGAKAEQFAYLTVNFACNFAHQGSEYAACYTLIRHIQTPVGDAHPLIPLPWICF